jgi:hypothetical protein
MGFGMTANDDTPMLFLPGVVTTMWGGPVRNLAEQLGVELDEVRQRTEPWYTDERIECKMATVDPGQMAAARFAVEGVRNGEPVITMEHVNRLTAAAAPDWPYPARQPRWCSPCRGGGRAARRTQYPCLPSEVRLD